jgi:hypothetical protein
VFPRLGWSQQCGFRKPRTVGAMPDDDPTGFAAAGRMIVAGVWRLFQYQFQGRGAADLTEGGWRGLDPE